MAKVEVFERFIDALDRRSDQLTTFDPKYDYKAGFMQSMLEQLARDSADARAKLVMATSLLEQWSNEHEANEKNEQKYLNAEVDGVA